MTSLPYIVDDSVGLDVVGHRTKLRAPYGVLAQLLGPPSDDVPEKCSTLWALRDGSNREHVIIKDWQDEDDRSFKLDAFRGLPTYDWDVWATDENVATNFCRWLSARVIAKLGEVKTLGPEGRVRLNEMLRSGVPLADAMRQVPMQTPSDVPRRFAWPIEG